MLKDRWEAALTLDEFIERAEVDQELWRSMRKRARVPAEFTRRSRDLPEPRYLLVLLEDWCGDASSTIPTVARLAEETPKLELRVLRRDENLDLMDAHLSGTSRAIPVVIVLDERFEEVGWWGSRPRELQAWVKSEQARAMETADRYREMRRWYARDQGRTTLDEIVTLLEETADDVEGNAAADAAPGPVLQGA